MFFVEHSLDIYFKYNFTLNLTIFYNFAQIQQIQIVPQQNSGRKLDSYSKIVGFNPLSGTQGL